MRELVEVAGKTPTFQARADAWQARIGLPENVKPPRRAHKLTDLGGSSGSIKGLLRPLSRNPENRAGHAQLLRTALAMRSQIRSFGGVASKCCGRRERIKGRTTARERPNVDNLNGTVTNRMSSVPTLPEHPTLDAWARYRMER